VQLGQPCPGGAGEGGSSPDKAGTCQYCQMVRCGERDEEEYTRNQRYYVPEGLTGSNLADWAGCGAHPSQLMVGMWNSRVGM
jgi:hypothetical protein